MIPKSTVPPCQNGTHSGNNFVTRNQCLFYIIFGHFPTLSFIPALQSRFWGFSSPQTIPIPLLLGAKVKEMFLSNIFCYRNSTVWKGHGPRSPGFAPEFCIPAKKSNLASLLWNCGIWCLFTRNKNHEAKRYTWRFRLDLWEKIRFMDLLACCLTQWKPLLTSDASYQIYTICIFTTFVMRCRSWF